jgi:hypothetical protein
METMLRRVQYLLAKMDLPPELIDAIQADLEPGPHDFTATDGTTRTSDVRVVVEGIFAHRFYQQVGSAKQVLARWSVRGHNGTVMECADSELAVNLAIEVAWLYRHPEPQPQPRHHSVWAS